MCSGLSAKAEEVFTARGYTNGRMLLEKSEVDFQLMKDLR